MSEPITISACLIVRDEEKHLPGCLDSLRPVVDEIVVVDTGSTDGTVKAARAGGARVIRHDWTDDFSAARNAALEEAVKDWILILDADERLEWKDHAAFREPLASNERWGCLLTLVNLLETQTSEVLLLRLFKNHPAVRYSGIIHESVEPALLKAAGDFERAVGRHPARIIHSGYQPQRRAEKGKDERDIRLLKKQISADPDTPYSWYKFAVHPYARQHLGPDVEKALWTAWALVQEKDPCGTIFSYTPEVAALLILACMTRRDLKHVRVVAVEAEKITRTSPNLEYALGVAALAAENLRGAADHLEAALSYAGRVLAIAPFEGVTGSLSLHTLSEVRYLQGEPEESYRLYSETAAFSNGEPVTAFFGPPSALIRQGDPGWAVFVLSLAVRLLPEDPYPSMRGGEILLELGLFEKSIGWLENAHKLSPGDARITDLLEEARTRHHPV